MAQITYVNKEYLYENGDIPAKNKVQDTDMNEIKNVVNSNETKELLAVTDTAPAQCSTGDKYFNTSTKKIYTATATNTWETTGVNPTRNTIYLEFTTQTAYAYDGDTLVSVGGGASGGGETLPVGSEIDFDGSVSDIPDGWEQVDDAPVYSTTETVCGTWIDGKPIYRKVLNNISIIEGTAHTIETGITNIENLTKLEGILNNTNNSQYVVIPAYYSPTIFISANYKYDENRIYYDSATFSGTAIIILEYTKTTD